MSHTALEEVKRKLEVQNKELHEKKVEALELQGENMELNGTWRTKMVDKGGGALPRPQVYSVSVHTDKATCGFMTAVPHFNFVVLITWVL